MTSFESDDYLSQEKIASRNINLGNAQLLQLRRSLIITADTLCRYGTPDTVRKTASDIPLKPLLNPSHSEHPFTQGWVSHDTLSGEYSKDEDGEFMSLRFTSPNEHDIIKVDLLPDVGWRVKEHRNPLRPTRENIFTNRDILRILDLKLTDTPTLARLMQEHAFPRFNPEDLLREPPSFPEKLIDAVQPSAKKWTELKSFQVARKQKNPAETVESLGVTLPDYSTSTIMEVTRAEATKSVDYSLRISHSGLEVAAAPHLEGNRDIASVSNVYEHSFSVPYGKDRIEATRTAFTVVGSSNISTRALKRLVKSESVDARISDNFRKSIQAILEKNEVLLLPPME